MTFMTILGHKEFQQVQEQVIANLVISFNILKGHSFTDEFL